MNRKFVTLAGMLASGALAATLTACGNSTSAPAQPPAAPTLTACASSHGMTVTSQPDSQTELYVAQSATATDGARSFGVYTFRTNANRDSWIKVAGEFGGYPTYTSDRCVIIR